MHNLRTKINQIDSEIINLLSQRMEISELIAHHKKEHDLTLLQPEREKEVIDKLIIQAKQHKLDKNFILNVYHLIIKESKNIQKKILNG